MTSRILVVTAVAAERDAVLAGLGPIGSVLDLRRAATSTDLDTPTHHAAPPGLDTPTHHAAPPGLDTPTHHTATPGRVRIDVLAGGVGPAAAAASTATALARDEYRIVLCMGIGGALAGRATFGDVVLARTVRAADLGAESPDGFVPLGELGFGRDAFDVDPGLLTALTAALPGAIVGEVLTVSTVTGTAARADELAVRHPHAVVEAMEGYGVAVAANAAGRPFAEVRTISNPVGPRDRSAWRIGPALAALTGAARSLGTLDG